ncbi:unnamed protein product [Ectocarpus sp. 13 AM-2016]
MKRPSPYFDDLDAIVAGEKNRGRRTSESRQPEHHPAT